MKSILQTIEAETLTRLLQLFPQNHLKESWSETKGQKGALISEIVQQPDIEQIGSFICNYLHTCKQHVYFLRHTPTLKTFPSPPFNASNLLRCTHASRGDTYGEHDCYIYLFLVSYPVYLREPFQLVHVPYVWPVMLQLGKSFCVMRCVKLARDLSSIFGARHVKTESRTLTEEILLTELGQKLPKGVILKRIDLNKAMKAMLEANLIDCESVQIKQTHQATTHTMDRGYTAKKALSPQAYNELLNSPLQKVRFKILSEDLQLNVFGCDPTVGFVDFPQYSEINATDNVLRAIISHNK